ncbi:MAG: peptidase S10, partial [Chloroflexi bacterium]|nr:peptidase S10 [Chloroflexota bacterium]
MANDKEEKPKDEEKKIPPKDNIVISKHTATVGGKKTKYTGTTGTMVLKEEA